MSEYASDSGQLTPRGTYGGVLHALTFGIFGNQVQRTSRRINTEYQIKPRVNDSSKSRGREIFEEKTFRSGLHQKSTVVNYSEMVANVFLILNIYK